MLCFTIVSTLFIMSDGKEEKRKVKQTNKAKQHLQHTQRQSLFLENVQLIVVCGVCGRRNVLVMFI